jgi:hypothetical protein
MIDFGLSKYQMSRITCNSIFLEAFGYHWACTSLKKKKKKKKKNSISYCNSRTNHLEPPSIHHLDRDRFSKLKILLLVWPQLDASLHRSWTLRCNKMISKVTLVTSNYYTSEIEKKHVISHMDIGSVVHLLNKMGSYQIFRWNPPISSPNHS